MSECSHVHVRASLLNPGFDITPLKFRSWIREEARDIDQKALAAAGDHHHSVIFLFLPEKTFNIIGAPKVDKILQDVTDRFHTILRIELRLVDAPMTMEEMVEEQRLIQAQFAEMAESDDKPTIH